MSKQQVIDPNEIKTRDYLILQIIQGVTKAGVHRDRRKHKNKYECRKSKRKDSSQECD